MTCLVTKREVISLTFSGRLEIWHDPANQALPFALWWQPAAKRYQRHCNALQLSARATVGEALDLDLAWAAEQLEQGESPA